MSEKIINGEKFLQWIDSIGQKEVADAIGVRKAAVWNWRHGLNRPTPEHAKKLTEFAGGALTLEDIYGE